jgi:hypothetical protein
MQDLSGRDVGDLFAAIARNVERLVRAHVRLEAASLRETAAAMAQGAGLVAAGVVLATMALLLVLLSAVARLREVMPLWAALLLAAAGAALVSAAVAGVGMSLLRRRPVAPPLESEPLERET